MISGQIRIIWAHNLFNLYTKRQIWSLWWWWDEIIPTNRNKIIKRDVTLQIHRVFIFNHNGEISYSENLLLSVHILTTWPQLIASLYSGNIFTRCIFFQSSLSTHTEFYYLFFTRLLWIEILYNLGVLSGPNLEENYFENTFTLATNGLCIYNSMSWKLFHERL